MAQTTLYECTVRLNNGQISKTYVNAPNNTVALQIARANIGSSGSVLNAVESR